MDARAQIPVSLPRANPTASYWQTPPDAEIADLRSTETLPERADVVIIGSGITGAAVAWNLLKQETERNESLKVGKVVMLEARQTCSGATGRNGGHTKAASYRSFPALASRYGVATAVKIARLELANIRATHAFARQHNISCHSVPCETVDEVYDAGQWAAAQAGVAAILSAIPPTDPASKYTLHPAASTQRQFPVHDPPDAARSPQPTSTTTIHGSVSYEAGYISAYRFVVGVLKLCLPLGLDLHTHTPATKIARAPTAQGSPPLWTIHTPRGQIIAPRVVLATNGYTAALLPDAFQGVIVPLRGQVTARRRPGVGFPRGYRDKTYSPIYADGFDYMVVVGREEDDCPEEDVMILGGGLVRGGLDEYGTTDDAAMNPAVSTYLEHVAAGYFGGDSEGGGMEWTGIMGYSPDGLPFVGEVPGRANGGLWVCAGFQGHGMVLCWMCARGLVEMMGGRDGDGLREWFPDCFRVSTARLALRFEARMPTH